MSVEQTATSPSWSNLIALITQPLHGQFRDGIRQKRTESSCQQKYPFNMFNPKEVEINSNTLLSNL